METRQFGKTDMRVNVLGFGGSEIRGSSLTDVSRLLNSALDAGINVIDTAECYGDSEELIGKAVAERRSDYYLFTKCGHAAGEDLPDLPDWHPRLLEASIDRSLRRLRTDHIDLIAPGNLSEDEFNTIRALWEERADQHWLGLE
jgi:aryl-alcohol dehydrogenase-like predicted oxidoreductase